LLALRAGNGIPDHDYPATAQDRNQPSAATTTGVPKLAEVILFPQCCQATIHLGKCSLLKVANYRSPIL
jgi:hypothetical protein